MITQNVTIDIVMHTTLKRSTHCHRSGVLVVVTSMLYAMGCVGMHGLFACFTERPQNHQPNGSSAKIVLKNEITRTVAMSRITQSASMDILMHTNLKRSTHCHRSGVLVVATSMLYAMGCVGMHGLFVCFTALPRNHLSKGSVMEILTKKKVTRGAVCILYAFTGCHGCCSALSSEVQS